MLLTNRIRDAVFAGEVDVAFRRWRKPTVKTGGRLRTSLGEVEIVRVEVIDPDSVTDCEARRAGYDSADSLRHDLFRERTRSPRGRTAKPTDESLVYRIEVRPGGADGRVALRSEVDLSPQQLDDVVARLDRMDTPRGRGARTKWTKATLDLIAAWPGRRAPELAEMEGLETLAFKTAVRKLKELGLTESLAVGYRLSPRGETVLRELGRRSIADDLRSL